MKKTRHTTEQTIRILRDAEGEQLKTKEVCRNYSVSAQTYYRWKSKYGGMDLKEAQPLPTTGRNWLPFHRPISWIQFQAFEHDSKLPLGRDQR